MYLYVTEKIKNFHKVGISNDIHKRYDQYLTLVPDLKLRCNIKLLNKAHADIIENTIKQDLREERLKKSECYKTEFSNISNLLIKCSILLNYIYFDYRLFHQEFNINSKGLFMHSTRGSKWNNPVILLLNDVYFGKKIPLITADRISKNKIKIYVFKKRNSLNTLRERINYNKDYLKKKYISLNNIFYETLKEFDNKIIDINNTPYGIKSFFSSIIKEKLFDLVIKKNKLFNKRQILSKNDVVNNLAKINLKEVKFIRFHQIAIRIKMK